MERAAWLRERRRIIEERADTLHAPTYDEVGGTYSNDTQQRMVARLLGLCPPRARILDAACGTGRYWPLFLAAECDLLGIDQSAGMLQVAHAKFPQVAIEKRGLQELAREDQFDAIACIDSMEFVFPEDWPGVLADFQRALRPHGLLYLSVELPEDDLPQVFQSAVEAGLPVVAGEYVKGGGYHYYPALDQVRTWLDTAGFDILEEATGDWYQHFLARTRENGGKRADSRRRAGQG